MTSGISRKGQQRNMTLVCSILEGDGKEVMWNISENL